MSYREAYESWLSNPYFDEDTKEELRSIANDEKEIEDRFYMDLEFGTAGLRGVIGAGTNRMNVYTVRKATQGLANYIIKVGAQAKGVAIAYDSRRMSPEFANEAALCLAANGIKAYIFESLRPTPELSYAVRYLGCTAGINVTASHNPPEYNGYKVYWEDGAQITPPHDGGIMAEVKAVTDYATTKTMSKEDAVAAGLYEVIGANIDDPYIAELKKLVLNQDAINAVADDLKIVYTPLHGTGNIPVRRVLKELGFKHVYVVPEQELPDGNFPTVSYPNPEAAEAFTLGLGMAKELDADLVLATDPDADRLGVYVKDSKTGEYHSLTGNMSGCLIGAYEISQRKEKQGLPADGAFVHAPVCGDLGQGLLLEVKGDEGLPLQGGQLLLHHPLHPLQLHLPGQPGAQIALIQYIFHSGSTPCRSSGLSAPPARSFGSAWGSVPQCGAYSAKSPPGRPSPPAASEAPAAAGAEERRPPHSTRSALPASWRISFTAAADALRRVAFRTAFFTQTHRYFRLGVYVQHGF